MNDDLLDKFEPSIRPLVAELVENSRIGICSGNVGIYDIKSGLTSVENGASCMGTADRFGIKIPFAGQSLSWKVIFIGHTAEYPPDFAFDDKSFMPETRQIQTLFNWKKEDKKTLVNVIEELLEFYRKHQVNQLEKHSRLNFEYSSLVHQVGITEEDIEVQFSKENHDGPTYFLIRLPINFSKIPPLLIEGNPADESAVLLATFSSPDGTKITPELFLSPETEKIFGNISKLIVPGFKSGECLMDYVPSICEMLNNRVDQILAGFEKRKQYITAFIKQFGTSVLEFDTGLFTSLSLLFEHNEFGFALHITLPLNFPKEKPVMVFQSIYHLERGSPHTKSSNNYPYSPRWSAEEMAVRAKAYIEEFVPKFQRNSTRNVLS